MLKSNKGFSLIELMIVVVVIGIIAAISVPNLLASRRAANEASALRSLRTMATAQAIYHATAGMSNYGTAANLYSQQLIDNVVAAANNVNVGGNPVTNTAKAGYRFSIVITAANPVAGVPASFVASAIPATTTGPTQTGAKRMCLMENGLMKSATTTIGTHYTAATCTTAAAFRP